MASTGLTGLLAVLAVITAVVALSGSGSGHTTTVTSARPGRRPA